MLSFRDTIKDEAPNLDRFSVLFGAAIFLSVILSGILAAIGVDQIGSLAIAWVGGVTAFVAVYQLRRPTTTEKPAVRQTFHRTEGGDKMDFGLRNYGSGPALYLQVEAVVADSEETLLKIKPRDRPLHLPEGEFLGFAYDHRVSGDEFLSELNAQLEDTGETGMVHLYFSYVSPDGTRVPEGLTVEPERDDKTILQALKEPDQKPRRMEISKIQENCA